MKDQHPLPKTPLSLSLSLSLSLLQCGFVAQLSKEPKSGLVLLLMGLGLIVVVNVHDLVAHLAGIYFRFQLMGFDPQLALVEFAVPLVQAAGSLLIFLGILFLFIQVFTQVSAVGTTVTPSFIKKIIL